jgi:uncharacterized membrane protein YqjE
LASGPAPVLWALGAVPTRFWRARSATSATVMLRCTVEEVASNRRILGGYDCRSIDR